MTLLLAAAVLLLIAALSAMLIWLLEAERKWHAARRELLRPSARPKKGNNDVYR